MSNNADQSTFPSHVGDSGLTKREYFAGLAMQGLLANDWKGYAAGEDECDTLATCAVNFADAILSQLEKQQP